MNRSAFFLLIAIICFFSSRAYSQNNPSSGQPTDQPVRIEIPATPETGTYEIATLGKEGFVLFFKSNEPLNDSMVKWYFAKYDENIRQLWVKSIPVPGAMEFVSKLASADTLTFLFHAKAKTRNLYYSHFILRLLTRDNRFSGKFTRVPDDVDFRGFQVLGRNAYLCFDQKNKPSHVQIIDLLSGVVTDHQVGQGNTSSILSITADTMNGRLLVSMKKQFSRGTYENYIDILDPAGSLLNEILISPVSANRFFRDVGFLPVNRDKIIAYGTYGYGEAQKSNPHNTQAGDVAGLFICPVVNGIQHNITMTNFLELKNADKMLNAKEILTLKKKKEKNNGSVGDYSLNLNVLMHPVLFHDGQFVLFVESYSPEYQSQNYTEFDFYGRPYTVSVPVFEGYRYQYGILAAYSGEGQLVWDNTMEVRNLRAFDLFPRQNIFFSGSRAILSYLAEGKIASKIIQENEVSEPLDFTPVGQMNPGDKLVSDSKNRMIPWYDNYFLCYGYQEIKNIALSDNSNRRVFYCTKIRFEP